jgi:hypothetical protein
MSKVCRFQATINGARLVLLLPCVEIVRFYYGHSTKLAYGILRGDFPTAPHILYNADGSFVAHDGSARLEVAPSMDRADAYTIGRFVLNPVGLRRGKVIMQRTMQVMPSRAIDVLPPFDGPWRLRVRGKWLSYGRSKAFLVFAIVRCEVSPPFKDLTVHGGVASEASTKTVRTRNEGATEPIERRRAITPATDPSVEAGDPDRRALPQRLPLLDMDARYPQMKLRYVSRRRKRGAGKDRRLLTSLPVDINDTPPFLTGRQKRV